jgi:hypothetical protein
MAVGNILPHSPVARDDDPAETAPLLPDVRE